jgi:hypothetical protein
MIFDYSHILEFYEASSRIIPNTQISSFGIGNIFLQVFSSPNLRLVEDFRIAAKSRGLSQLWPLPNAFWPFTKGATKFPTKLVLDDDAADIIANAFSGRIDALMGRPLHLAGRNWNA